MNGDNPCNVCKSQNDCDGCIFERLVWTTKGECDNDECMCHYECGCLLSLDNMCKSSSVFVGEGEE